MEGDRRSQAAWKRTWGAAPQEGHAAAVTIPGGGGVTLRQLVRVSGGGEQVRVRFTNEHGHSSIRIGAASLGLAAPGGGVQLGSFRQILFSEVGGTTIPAGAPLVSDTIDFSLPALTEVVISIYLPNPEGPLTSHNIPTSTGWLLQDDATEATEVPPAAAPLPNLTLLSAVEVLAPAPAVGIVAIGDSITDGAGSTPGTHRSWPEILAGRLHESGVSSAFVSNQGISGNRLLHPGYGDAALARFDRDVLSTPGLDIVIVFQGINDIGFQYGEELEQGPEGFFMGVPRGFIAGADAIIGAYQQLIRRAHDHGARIFGATLTPFLGAEFFSPEGEHVRQQVNSWIRSSGAFEAILDFEAAWLDPGTQQIAGGYHWGDCLHGSDAGYQALADSIDLSLFT